MVEKYVPKVGDKVRATLGENVLVGDVVAEYAGDLIEVLVTEDEGLTLDLNLWSFEQVVSVPTKRGAVVRVDREVGAVILVRSRTPFWYTFETGIRWTDQDVIDAGFTVLFDGVDE